MKILRKTLSDRRNELAQERIFEENAAELCRTTMLQGVSGFINSKCQVSVNLLIGETLSMDALKICQQIAERQTTDKVSQWIEIHIKPGPYYYCIYYLALLAYSLVGFKYNFR